MARRLSLLCDLDGWRIAASFQCVRGEDADDVRRIPARRSPDTAGFIAGPAAKVDGLVAEAEQLDTAALLSR